MIKSWKQFNEKQLDLFAGTAFEKPELIHNNLYPIGEDDIRDFLTEIEDENYSVVVNFGFLNTKIDEYTEIINGYYVRPCISVNIDTMSNTGNEDVTSCLTSFIKRVSHKFKDIKVRDEGGFIDINSLKLEGGIFIKDEEIEIEYPLSVYLIWFDDVKLTDKMIWEYYTFPEDKFTTFTNKGSALLDIPRDRISDWIVSNKSDYKDIIDDPDFDIYDWYHDGDWKPDHESFFNYYLENETIDMLLKCCFKNFDKLKEEYPEFLGEYDSLEEFIQKIKSNKKTYSWSTNWKKLGEFLEETELSGDIYNELRNDYADLSMQSKAESDYEEIIRVFDKSVTDILETTIVQKLEHEETKRFRTKDSNGNDVWKETTYMRPYYRLEFNLSWLERLEANELFNLGSVEDEIGNWVYNYKEKEDLEPNFSDYSDVNNKEFNKEARAQIKWQIENQK